LETGLPDSSPHEATGSSLKPPAKQKAMRALHRMAIAGTVPLLAKIPSPLTNREPTETFRPNWFAWRASETFDSRPRQINTTGKSAKPVQPFAQKYSAFVLTQITGITPLVSRQ
jgi:hypothetical protein